MGRRLAAYILGALSLIPLVAYAQQTTQQGNQQNMQQSTQQNTQQNAQRGQVTLEVNASKMPWYNVAGPRLSFSYNDEKAGDFSGAYVPLSESYGSAQDAHLKWTLPRAWTGKLEITPILEHSDLRGLGGGVRITRDLTGSANPIQLSIRAETFKDATTYGEVKLLGMLKNHLDLDVGAKHEKGKTNPYGYFTINGGKWDDTFTLGVGPDRTIWQDYSAERKDLGIMTINYYNPFTGNWTSHTYFGKGGVTKFWFSRFTDRLLANNDINPKERSHILTFPRCNTFAEYCAEFRAENTDGKKFYTITGGKRFKVKDINLGFALGFQHVNNTGRITNMPTGEVLLQFPLKNWTVSASYALRKAEGGYQFSITRSF
jgi:hypothetical protein